MDVINIFETLIGAFWGAFFAFLSGIAVNNFNEKRKQKYELKRFFGLLDTNQNAIDEIGRLFSQGIAQGKLMNQIITVRDSNDPRHKLYNIKKSGIKLTLEICEQCKEPVLQEKILRQIDFQDKVFKMLCGLYELSEDELIQKLESSEKVIHETIIEMKNNQEKWIDIKSGLIKLRFLPKKT